MVPKYYKYIRSKQGHRNNCFCHKDNYSIVLILARFPSSQKSSPKIGTDGAFLTSSSTFSGTKRQHHLQSISNDISRGSTEIQTMKKEGGSGCLQRKEKRNMNYRFQSERNIELRQRKSKQVKSTEYSWPSVPLIYFFGNSSPLLRWIGSVFGPGLVYIIGP